MNMQALEGDDAPEDSHECPVCYECLSGLARTLSCGHVFCHDCLVKTLVSVNKDGGMIKDMIICPICRHITFLKKLEVLASEGTKKDAEEGQTLEVPVLAPTGNLQFQSARRDSRNTAPNGFNWIVGRLRIIVERLNRHRLIKPSQIDSQIFIISAQGRPMKEEDALSVVTVTVQPNRRQRRRLKICTTSRCLVVLLLLFTLLALVAATLPWVLLA
ncbi:RING finger protein 222 [Osmerus mordax]|uniref:RING finger protein 222 n=1 Tax=Osmerus mordax TaxID=8014 RepID=UPI00350F1FF3